MRRYKNKRTYLYAKRRKEYNRYKRNFRAKRAKLEEKGLTPYDSLELSYQEYFAQKKMLRDEGETNTQRRIIQDQLYKYSYKSTVALKKAMQERGMEEGNWSLARIRSGEDFDLSFLSDINEQLKKDHPNWTGKQRMEYIQREWFGYAKES